MKKISPFLSVIIRTQGFRPEFLDEALLCLMGQNDQDFEVIIVLHASSGMKELELQIQRFPEEFQAKIKIVQALQGLRAVPVNAGINAALGNYLVFFDDDDLLAPNWVEEFHKNALLFPGCIIRTQAATLEVKKVADSSGRTYARQLSSPRADYQRDFDLLDHFLVNHTPFMTLAFPRAIFNEFGITADENLAVCEDWDLILRASQVAEVISVPTLTSFYRRWEDSETSYSSHSEDEWRLSEERVIEKMAESQLTLPGNYIHRIRELLQIEKEAHQLRHEALEKRHMEVSLSWKITAPLRSIRSRFGRS